MFSVERVLGLKPDLLITLTAGYTHTRAEEFRMHCVNV